MKQMMTKMKVRQRSVYIDSLKAFAIITVIVGHCIQYGSGLKYLNERLFFSNPIFKFIYSFHMPLFMLLSGYLFADSVNKNDYILSLKAKIYNSEYSVLGKNILHQIYNNLFRMVIGFLGSISIMYIFIIPSRKMSGIIKTCIGYIGQNTLGVYIISGIFIGEVVSRIAAPLSKINVLYIFFEVIVSMAFSLIITSILKRNVITNYMFLGNKK